MYVHLSIRLGGRFDLTAFSSEVFLALGLYFLSAALKTCFRTCVFACLRCVYGRKERRKKRTRSSSLEPDRGGFLANRQLDPDEVRMALLVFRGSLCVSCLATTLSERRFVVHFYRYGVVHTVLSFFLSFLSSSSRLLCFKIHFLSSSETDFAVGLSGAVSFPFVLLSFSSAFPRLSLVILLFSLGAL